jgi:hypothetical protein
MRTNRRGRLARFDSCTKHRTPLLTSGMSPFDEATRHQVLPLDDRSV